jgi:hypothetical protein
MSKNGIVKFAVASALAFSAGSAIAASDYLLEIKGVAGESGATDTSQTIEISSFSWGTSNPTSVGSGGLSAGKASMQGMTGAPAAAQSAAVQTARESGTGMATGKSAAPATAAAGGPADAAAAPPKVGDMATVTVFYRESPTQMPPRKTSTACTKGEHIAEAVLTAQGQRYEMHDVVVTGCPVANGQRGKELTGHVTLIK